MKYPTYPSSSSPIAVLMEDRTVSYQIGDKVFEVRQTGNKFFYFSQRAGRWLPVAKAKVAFS